MIDQKEFKAFVSEIKTMLSISSDNLHIECREQAALYEETGDWSSKLKAESKIAKDHLDYLGAKYSMDVRAEPAKYGLAKISEASITAAVLLAPEIIKAKAELRDKEKDAEYISVLLNAFEQRKSMLRDLVSLYIHKYYSDNAGNVSANKDVMTAMAEDEIGRQRDARRDSDDG